MPSGFDLHSGVAFHRHCSSARAPASVGIILIVYLLVQKPAIVLDGWGLNRIYAIMLPSLWMLGATIYCAQRGVGRGDFFQAASRTGWHSAVAIATLTLALSISLEFLAIPIRLSGDNAWNSRMAVNVILLVPFAEEYFFRGLILGYLMRSLDKKTAVLLVSALFAFLHVSQAIFLQMFILSILLSLVTLKTKNVIASAVLHLCWNLIVVGNEIFKPITDFATPC